MNFTVARAITFLVVLTISLRIFGASVTALPSISEYRVTTVESKHEPTVFGAFILEKTEEQSEKTQSEKDGIGRSLLIDFSQLAISLSFYHSPQVTLSVSTLAYDVRPPVHQFNCVFLL